MKVLLILNASVTVALPILRGVVRFFGTFLGLEYCCQINTFVKVPNLPSLVVII